VLVSRRRAPRPARRLSGSRLGLVLIAPLVDACAVAVRELIFAFTRIATGHQRFGQPWHPGSLPPPSVGSASCWWSRCSAG
jgi:hypothetical protein